MLGVFSEFKAYGFVFLTGDALVRDFPMGPFQLASGLLRV
jgi:hypothetical protein